MQNYTERLTANFLTMQDNAKQEFEMRIAECSTLAFRVAYGVLRNREDAEDVTQEAFAKAYKSFSSLRDRGQFRSWIVRIAWRMALDFQRSRKRREKREEIQVSPVAVSTDNSLVEKQRAERLWQAIDSLPEKMRIVIVLAGIEEHDTHAIAAMLDVPEGTVKSRLFHARRQLKELLQ